ncbi:MAG: hypothetical protein M1823_001180 [Watsoniomyces obsoletus]|nr:MAG: hypothetical protein M1823_001180 [Watsoniomyces obsoletus]
MTQLRLQRPLGALWKVWTWSRDLLSRLVSSDGLSSRNTRLGFEKRTGHPRGSYSTLGALIGNARPRMLLDRAPSNLHLAFSTSTSRRDLDTVTVPSSLDRGGLPQEICHPSLPNEAGNSITSPPGTIPVKQQPTSPPTRRPLESPHVPSTYKISVTRPQDEIPTAGLGYWGHDLYRGPQGEPVRLHYCRSTETSERVAQLFLEDRVLGVDLEWKPSALIKDGPKKNVALIQLANEARVALFHVALFRESEEDPQRLIPPSLKKIIESSEITKVGIAIKGDCTRLRNYLGLDPQGLLELSHLHKLVKYSQNDPGMVDRRLVSLAIQMNEHLDMPICKSQDVRSSDWTKLLNWSQLQYAASDAYAVFHLHDVLERKRKALHPTPPYPAHAELNLPILLAPASKLVVSTSPDMVIPASDTNDAPEQQLLLDDEKINNNILPSERSAEQQQPPPIPIPIKPPPHPQVIQADTWILDYRAGIQPPGVVRAMRSQLRAYVLWHRHDLNLEDVARLLRDPPLQMTTVGGYILEAIRLEKKLAYDLDRLRMVLEYLPASRKRLYRHLLIKSGGGRNDGGVLEDDDDDDDE